MKKQIMALSFMASWSVPGYAQENERPNFVWFMAEDVAPQFMGLYNDGEGAHTPYLERMAREGVIFNNAYSNAPVSSAARSTLITGCYAPRLGASWHRGLEQVPLPEGLQMFPFYLREAGYYTANAAKTDYNLFLDEHAWDRIAGKMGEWRNRPDKNQPFFFVRTNASCHESCLHFDKERINNGQTRHQLSEVNLLPFHPDTRTFRYTYAAFYDKIGKADEELGILINMLKEDGLLDNTFIFYFGDNGGSLPGSKGYTGETGLKVPLVVYIPEKWRDRIPLTVNSRVDGLVSFLDFGPTLLHLAGLRIPEQMDGRPFLGEDISKEDIDRKDIVYGYGDRFDELYAFNRTVRKGKWKYSRNFLPYQPKSLFAAYRYKQQAFVEWEQFGREGKLNTVQRRFFEPQGPEELYDLSADPYETRNLSADPSYRNVLRKMRGLLDRHLVVTNDLGLLPESIWLQEGKENPVAYGKQSHKRIQRLLRVANLQYQSFPEVKKEVKQALGSADEAERCWALTACIGWGKQAAELTGQIESMAERDASLLVRSRALVFGAVTTQVNPAVFMKKVLLQARSGAETLWILNDMAYLKDRYPEWDFSLTEQDIPVKCEGTDWRREYLSAFIR